MELEKLQLEKETAAAVAEAEVLREAADELKERSSCNHSKLDCTPTDPNTRVREYLADQASQAKQEMTGPQPPVNEEIVQGYQPGSPDRPTQKPPIISYHSLTHVSKTPNLLTTGTPPTPGTPPSLNIPQTLGAREDGNLPGLAYLDTARGLRPFITKLPSSLQDRWLSVGSEYKERHQVTFPPFKCTQVCGGDLSEKSCSKICLVNVYPADQPDKTVRMYAIIDEQSNRSLVRSDFFDTFKNDGPSFPYSLKTCAGVIQTMGRRASGFQVESLDGKNSLPLPSPVECDKIPNDRSGIPTPEAALHHPHLRKIAHLIPTVEPKTPIMLLLGRDILRVHKVRQQINSPHDAPYAQKLDLGWVIVGNVYLGKFHPPTIINTLHTHISDGGRPTLFDSCPNKFEIKESFGISKRPYSTEMEDHLFQRTRDDERAAPSIEDIAFLNIMELGAEKDKDNSWVAPLPFRSPRRRLPYNRKLAERRPSSLRRSLDKKPEMQRHFLSFMEGLFENGHAEAAPSLRKEEECWYLPIFGVYHPKKPGKIRVVFDSSAKHDGVSLNDVLISEPDLNNTRVGVLTRFRKEIVAVTADIEQMFHCFLVKEHRNFLRILWYRDNDPTKGIAEYRMKVHVFGNSPSPAVAIYCPRQAVRKGQPNYDPAVEELVNRNFYILDCLKSLPYCRSYSLLAPKNTRHPCRIQLKATQNSLQQRRSYDCNPTPGPCEQPNGSGFEQG
ncbi:unnamed protein product [Acanthosepion pharaonis]|uniref:Uncharacterized protein n=1 Tax=Acanthosepion pharaonis TaxID=158019 RepID=A0A812CU65_ACAPH|nr:unnamed protein product [Sepia pharaonis]